MEEPSRASSILRLLRKELFRCSHRILKHQVIRGTEYIKVESECPNGVKLYIREFWFEGKLRRYAYHAERHGQLILRYDNAPHHPDTPSFPHHKHLPSSIKPAERHSLKDFIAEISNLIFFDTAS